MKVDRKSHLNEVLTLLRRSPVVAILGARQVGKTTLAGAVAARFRGPTTRFDLEDPRDVVVLDQPTLALEGLRGLIVIDEVQRRPDLFPILRVLADRPRHPARFLVLGSASPELLRQGSETLAGRIAFHHLDGFDMEETGSRNMTRLWMRGGFPRSYLAGSNAASDVWRRDFIQTFLERDLPALTPGSLGLAPSGMHRLWTMLAHYHGQIWNASEIGRSFGLSHTTIRHYLDLLEGAFVVRQLAPWAENVGKRIVKAPKVYVSDTGLLHTLLGLGTPAEVLRHPKLGASWEGFLLSQATRRLRARPEECFFWATHAGAELDLLVVSGGRRLGFEMKRTDAPKVTPSMRIALETLRLDSLDVIHAGESTFPMADRIRALAASDLTMLLSPLRRP
jgi:predicted AAA+ superfamily ATPase